MPIRDETKEVRPLTSVELLDAAVWREIGTEDPQPASAFIEALARLLGRWLLVRSDTPEMDAITVIWVFLTETPKSQFVSLSPGVVRPSVSRRLTNS
jgi:hypothetical protein